MSTTFFIGALTEAIIEEELDVSVHWVAELFFDVFLKTS